MSHLLDVLLADAEQRYADAAKAFAALTEALKHQRGVQIGDPGAIARQRARSDLLRSPGIVSEWLHDECRAFGAPIDLSPGARGGSLHIPTLLAIAFGGATEDARHAALEHLRQSFCVEHRTVIEERANATATGRGADA